MQVLPLLRSRAHDGFLAVQYDNVYTPLLEMAGLDVISFQVRSGLPKFNSAAITALVDRYYLASSASVHVQFFGVLTYLTSNICLQCRWRPETHSFHLPFGE